MEAPPQNVTALDGKDATVSCRAVGAPSPNITWIYNGKCCGIKMPLNIKNQQGFNVKMCREKN